MSSFAAAQDDKGEAQKNQFREEKEVQSEITIRESRREDARAIAAILRALGWFEAINRMASSEVEHSISQHLELCRGDGCNTVLVAESPDGSVIGYLAVHWFPNVMRGMEGYISELFIHPSATGKGAGSRLLSAVYDYARKRGCKRLLLMNRRSRESYQRGFYAKHGWEELRDGAFFTFAV
jgi:GNAT superfamily N-acetyltransferase